MRSFLFPYDCSRVCINQDIVHMWFEFYHRSRLRHQSYLDYRELRSQILSPINAQGLEYSVLLCTPLLTGFGLTCLLL